MALKDHSLDDKIIKAAFDEFMEFGFQKASIRKIADCAGVTPGAVYTRYDSKDDLFCSLVSNFLSAVKAQSEPIGKCILSCWKVKTWMLFWMQFVKRKKSIWIFSFSITMNVYCFSAAVKEVLFMPWYKK